MTITIDPAGRVVIPKPIRDELCLESGTELEVETRGNEIRLRAPSTESCLVEKRGVLVFDGGEGSDIDVAEFINRERNARAVSAT